MSKPWGGAGAWAAEAERAEAEEKELAAAYAASGTGVPPDAFPSLGESLSSKSNKKKKPVTFSISEFTVGKYVGPGGKSRTMPDSSRGLTTEEMMMLPTGPRDRSGEEEQYSGIGGGFRDYGAYRGGGGGAGGGAGGGGGDRERDRGFGGGFERERESGGGFRSRDEPSRADENSDWGATKKPVSAFGGGGYEDERRGSRMSDRDLPSRADEAGNWGATKKPFPPAPVDAYDRRTGRFEERREGFDESRPSRADEVDSWATSKKPVPVAPERRSAGGFDSSYREAGADADRWSRREHTREEPQRRRLVLAPRTRPVSISPPPGPRNVSETTYSARPSSPGGMSDSLPPPPRPSSPALSDSLPPPRPKTKSNPFGSARPREDILAEKGQDWRRLDAEYVIKDRDSRPSSSHSSRPETPEVFAEVTVKPRPKVNPFGDAKPREVLLEEKGKDWRKIDFELEHRAVDRPETEDEKKLKEEIRVLTELSKQEDEAGGTKVNGVVSEEEVEGEDVKEPTAKEHLLRKERELEQLIRALDDKVRFSQRMGERPGSRSGRGEFGRSFDSLERPGSRSGRGDSRGYDSTERPGSRSGRGDGGRNFDSIERPGSRQGRGEGGRNYDSLERPGSRTGRSESGRNYDSQERPGSRTGRSESGRNYDSQERPGSRTGRSESGRNYDSQERPGSRPYVESGRPVEYSREGRGADIWTRSGEESGRDRRGSWGDRDRFDDRVNARRF